MKKLIPLALALTLLTLSSCEQIDEVMPDTTYVFRMDLGSEVDQLVQNGLGTIDVRIYEYDNNGNMVSTKSISSWNPNSNYNFTANNQSSDVKVRLTVKSNINGKQSVMWVQEIYHLTKYFANTISIGASTTVGSSEP